MNNYDVFGLLTTETWSDQLEIVAVELITQQQARCILCVRYKLPNCDHDKWRSLFESLLQVAEKYEKIITGDFNFPELDRNCSTSSSQNISESSMQFHDLISDFFLEQVNPFLSGKTTSLT